MKKEKCKTPCLCYTCLGARDNELNRAKKAERKITIDIIKLFEYTLYPHQVKRSKEWMDGYNYCKKGIVENAKNTIKSLK